jgi:hypothetical protein
MMFGSKILYIPYRHYVIFNIVLYRTTAVMSPGRYSTIFNP